MCYAYCAMPDSTLKNETIQKRVGGAFTLAPPPDERADCGPEPYELLIEEAMIGDPTLFARADSVLESWRIVERILTEHEPVQPYRRGSWGPRGSADLVRRHGGWPGEPPSDPGR